MDYLEIKQQAKKIYSKIGQVPCPSLGGEYIIFNRFGFGHLIRKGHIPRPKSEQKRRLLLLKYAEQIVRNLRAKIYFRQTEEKYFINRHGQKLLTTSIAKFWTFVEIIDSKKIKLVIRQLGEGQKHFLSIMESDRHKKYVRHQQKSR